MDQLTAYEKKEILDNLGRKIIEYRDFNLSISMECATGKSINPIKAKQYSVLENISTEQREAVYDLLSEAITSAIFDFLDMFEANEKDMKLVLIKGGQEYDMAKISEKMGSEIACYEDGWIQKFSKIGRFVM